MKVYKLYATILVFSLLLGLGVFAFTPDQATAIGCGDPPCHGRYCCDEQGVCQSGFLEWGVCWYAPYACTNQCGFSYEGCLLEEFCQL